jgi:predicted SAM-dependent methyltransferase
VSRVVANKEFEMIADMKDRIKSEHPGLARILAGTRSRVISLRGFATRSRVRRLVRRGGDLFVEVGAGDKPGKNGWITVDVTRRCDVYWDMRKGLPFPDESVARIYSSHFLEHLSFDEGQAFLSECMRVLALGGSFSICVPDARMFIEAYWNRSSLEGTPFSPNTPGYNHTTSIDFVNYIAYMYGQHKYMFDEENLIHLLRKAGLKDARARAFDPRLDLESRKWVSIYAEGEK